jgi:hypothetical protein
VPRHIQENLVLVLTNEIQPRPFGRAVLGLHHNFVIPADQPITLRVNAKRQVGEGGQPKRAFEFGDKLRLFAVLQVGAILPADDTRHELFSKRAGEPGRLAPPLPSLPTRADHLRCRKRRWAHPVRVRPRRGHNRSRCQCRQARGQNTPLRPDR